MTKIKDIISNISNVKAGTWARLILMVVSLVNMALAAAALVSIIINGGI